MGDLHKVFKQTPNGGIIYVMLDDVMLASLPYGKEKGEETKRIRDAENYMNGVHRGMQLMAARRAGTLTNYVTVVPDTWRRIGCGVAP